MLRIPAMPLKLFRDTRVGARAIIVGSGPTEMDYRDLQKTGDPIFFLNDSIFLDVPKQNHFFFTHHIEMNKYLDTEATYLLNRKRWVPRWKLLSDQTRKRTKPFIPIDMIWLGHIAETLPKWSWNKDYICQKRCLVGNGGSITTLIHFLWFCGFNSILGVGIDPNSVTADHDARIVEVASQQRKIIGRCIGLKNILQNMLLYFDWFGMNADYV